MLITIRALTVKEAVSRAVSLFYFAHIASYASLCAMELNVRDDITCKRQNHSFLSKKCVSHTL